MTDRHSPTIQRRMLGMEMRKIRDEAGWSPERVRAELEISAPKLSRIERGEQGLSIRDLIAMLTKYGVPERIQELTELRAEAQTPGWFQQLGVSPGAYVDFEAGATRTKMWSPMLLPGPLQSEEYARAVMRALRTDLGDEAIDAEVRVRLERGRLLRQRGGLRGWFVLGEAAVRTPVGGAAKMRRALQHLLSVVDNNPRVTVQILPIDAGEHAGMEGGVSILEFELPSPTIAYVEYPSGAAWLEKPSDIERATLTFNHVLAAALDPQVSIGCIEQLVKEMGED